MGARLQAICPHRSDNTALAAAAIFFILNAINYFGVYPNGMNGLLEWAQSNYTWVYFVACAAFFFVLCCPQTMRLHRWLLGMETKLINMVGTIDLPSHILHQNILRPKIGLCTCAREWGGVGKHDYRRQQCVAKFDYSDVVSEIELEYGSIFLLFAIKTRPNWIIFSAPPKE